MDTRDKVCRSVEGSVFHPVRDSVYDSVWYPVVYDSVWYPVRNSVKESVEKSVWRFVRYPVWNSVENSVKDFLNNYTYER